MPLRGTLSVDKARGCSATSPQFPLDNGFVRLHRVVQGAREREAGALRPGERPRPRAVNDDGRRHRRGSRSIRMLAAACLGRPAWRVDAVTRASSAAAGSHPTTVLLTPRSARISRRRRALLQDVGFRTIDVALTLRGVGADRAPAADAARAVRTRRGPGAVARDRRHALSRSRGSTSIRRSPRWLAHRVKATWAANFFDGKRGDGMVVAERRAEPSSGSCSCCGARAMC